MLSHSDVFLTAFHVSCSAEAHTRTQFAYCVCQQMCRMRRVSACLCVCEKCDYSKFIVKYLLMPCALCSTATSASRSDQMLNKRREGNTVYAGHHGMAVVRFAARMLRCTQPNDKTRCLQNHISQSSASRACAAVCSGRFVSACVFHLCGNSLSCLSHQSIAPSQRHTTVKPYTGTGDAVRWNGRISKQREVKKCFYCVAAEWVESRRWITAKWQNSVEFPRNR